MSNFEIPHIGYGTYNIPRSQTAKCVFDALEVGYRLIDTATIYYNERETAQGIRDFLEVHPEVKRSEIIYTSKVWDDMFGYDLTRRAVDESVEKAGEPIDLYLLHDSGHGPEERRESWLALEEKVRDGKLRHIGVSNWGIRHLRELKDYATIPCVVNQIEVNPWKRMDELVEHCKREGIVVEVYSPLILGKKNEDPQLNTLAKKYGVTPSQILLRYLQQRGTVPLPKTTSKQRMIENLETLKGPEISGKDMKEIGDEAAYVMAIPGWDPTKWP